MLSHVDHLANADPFHVIRNGGVPPRTEAEAAKARWAPTTNRGSHKNRKHSANKTKKKPILFPDSSILFSMPPERLEKLVRDFCRLKFA